MAPPFQLNPIDIDKNLIQFSQCRYASETIDSWCLQCYLIRHAPLKVKFKKISGQYWLPSPTIIQLSSYLQGWFQTKSVTNNAQWAVALPFIISAKKHSPSGNGFPSSWHVFRLTFFSPLGVEFVPFSALIPFILVLHSLGFPILVRVLKPG